MFKLSHLKTLLKKSIAVALCAAFLITASLASAETAFAANTTISGTITSAVNLRKGPTTEFAIVISLSKGDKVQIKSRVWGTSYEVTAIHNKTTYEGYVPASYVKASKEVPESMERTEVAMPDQTGNTLIGQTGYINTSTVLRKSATGASAKVVTLSVNDTCIITASGMGWYQVTAIHNSKTYSGCVYGKYLTINATDYKGKTGYVNYDFLNVRAKASTSAKKIDELYKSQAVTIQSRSNGFYKVKYVSGTTTKTGYVSTEYITIATKGTMNAKTVLRKKASAIGTKLLYLKSGVKVTIVSESKGWMKVKYTTGGKTYTGFVLAELVNV